MIKVDFFIIGAILHLATPFGIACPSRAISAVNDTGWHILQQIGFRDPMGKAWPIIMRTGNLGKDINEDEIWIKLARDTNLEQMFSGGYYRTADYEKGGEWQVCTYFFQFTG